MRRRPYWVGILVGLSVGSACAGEIKQTAFRITPVINVTGGAVSSCGIALMGVPTDVQPGRPTMVFDGSLQVWRDGMSLGKAGLRRVTLSKTAEPTADVVVPASTFWFKLSGASPLKPVSGTVPADSKGYALQAFNMREVLLFLDALQQGSGLVLGVRATGEKNDAVFAGPAVMAGPDFAQYLDCIRSLAAEISSREGEKR